MGTRADFYVGRGADAEWLGSIAWDGYPAGIDNSVHLADSETEYRAAVATFFDGRDDATLPEHGWPWPWDTSATSDYAYAYDGGAVYSTDFEDCWFEVKPFEPCYGEPTDDDEAEDSVVSSGDRCVFPNMKHLSNFTLGSRSGVITLGGPA